MAYKTNLVNLGRTLRLLRIANEYSYDSLSEETGIPVDKIKVFEAGQCEVALNEIVALSKAFKISKNALLFVSADKEKSKYKLSQELLKLLEKMVNKFNIEET